jgi:hypothetical protein
VEISDNKSRNDISFVMAGGLCCSGSDVPLGGASSSVDARFRFACGWVVSASGACDGVVDVPLATTSAADMVFVYQVRVDGLECLVEEKEVLRDGFGNCTNLPGEWMSDVTGKRLQQCVPVTRRVIALCSSN